MIYIKVGVLLISLLLAACSNKPLITPKNYYLPEAIIGKPYQQIIYLSGARPNSINIRAWPDDTTLDWQFSRTYSSFWQEDRRGGFGDAIEIIVSPTDNSQKEIKIGVWATAYTDMLHRGARVYKEYIIKLVPDPDKSVTKP